MANIDKEVHFSLKAETKPKRKILVLTRYYIADSLKAVEDKVCAVPSRTLKSSGSSKSSGSESFSSSEKIVVKRASTRIESFTNSSNSDSNSSNSDNKSDCYSSSFSTIDPSKKCKSRSKIIQSGKVNKCQSVVSAGSCSSSDCLDRLMGNIYYVGNSQTSTPILTPTTAAVVINPITILDPNSTDFDMPVNGRLRYLGKSTASFLINIVLSVKANSGVNQQYSFYAYKNGILIPNSEVKSNIIDNLTYTIISLNFITKLSYNDYIELYVAQAIAGNNGIDIGSLSITIS